MTPSRTVAIVGAGLAGAKAAEGARQAGYDGRILLIGDEAALPYERPPLSKAVVRGEAEPASAAVHPGDFYADNDIELVTARATALDAHQRRLGLDTGEELAFDAAVLATGTEPRRLAVPGADLDGVLYLRTLDDAVRLRDAIRSATRVAVIGAGWIGSEVAASARQIGADVVLVDPAPVPLHRVLGPEIGAVFGHLHAENGVVLQLGTGVRELRGDKHVESLLLADGRVEAADVVVAGIGVIPRVELAREAGMHVDNGVIVDHYLETGARGIYAAGDIANSWHPHYGRYLRVEHWANALNQGTTAGRNATGRREAYDRLPYFYSDQYDLGLEYVGRSQPGDELAVRGDLEGREFIAFWHDGEAVTAAMAVNTWGVIDDLKTIVAADRRIDIARLIDPGLALDNVA